MMTYDEEMSAINKGREEMAQIAKQVMEQITRCDCSRVSECNNPVMLMGKFNNAIHSALIGLQSME